MSARTIACAVFVCLVLAGAESAAQWVRQGREFKATGDAAAALRAFERALALDPESAEIEDEVGFLLAATGRPSEAMPHFEKAVRLDPEFAPAHYHLGVAYWLAKDPARSIPTDAARELAESTRLRSGHPAAWNELGLARQKSGDFAGAVEACRRAVELE